ncbi:SlyX family protein [Azovibrio restrictus]|uniref:SlyX family protein n=1 Tax=Azovibrio restrictus TaxID=146938 RepID=UPI000421F94E|nr:SlyX family protein [Azovibrio restrictus]MDD3483925.1 SlyX family protein [Azovibrio restrictus]
MEERITDLEIKFSFAQDLLETLNTTVYRQQQQIDLLVQELKALRLQMQSMAPAQGGRNLADEIPPHY